MPLDPQHRQWLEVESAISPEIIERAGVYSEYQASAAAKLLGRAARHWEGHLPVLMFPYRTPCSTRDHVRMRGRPLKPFEMRRDDGSYTLAKYVEAKGSSVHLYFGPSLLSDSKTARDVSIPVFITEGERKCLSAESKGLSCIAISGVTQWHVKGSKDLHPDFAWITVRGRTFYLCFDRDAIENKQVRDQELALARALEAAGGVVYIVRFPADAPKLDDFFATHEFTEFDELLEDARENGKPPTPANVTSEEWKEVVAKLRIDGETGLPIKDVDTIARVLMFHPRWQGVLAFDVRKERQMFMAAPPFSEDVAIERATVPRPLIDSDTTRIADWLVAQGSLGWQLQPKPAHMQAAIALVCERNRVDSVRDYLVSLVWDGTPRLDKMGVTYFGCKDTAYTRAVFSKWMLSAVARIRTPGCQVDHVLVLEGPQGIGKSTALKVLAGEENFSDTLPEIPSRDAHEHCIGPWIIELAELDHMRKSDATALKAFISAQRPAFRSAYGYRTMEHPRRCVFAASTNESGYLADPTGNRRFWPVECKRADSVGLARDRDQLWAEALVRVRAGESWHLTDETAKREAEEEQQARRQVDPWYEPVAAFVRGRRAITVAAVLDHLGQGPEDLPRGYGSFVASGKGSGASRRMQHDQRSANRVAAILRDLRWVRRMLRVDGVRVWHYVQDQTDVVTGSRGSGDTPVTGQVYDFATVSPVSPVSPVDPSNTRASTPQIDLPNSLPPFKSNSLSTSGDSGDTGSKVTESSTYPGTTPSPVSGGSGDKPPARPRRLL
jgi:hypothetical protein